MDSPFNIDFVSLSILEFSFQEIKENIERKDLDVRVSTDFIPQWESNRVKVEQRILIFHLGLKICDTLVEAEFGNIDLASLFNGGNRIEANEIFYKILAGLTFSTARGIIWSKVASSKQSDKLLLPVLDPGKLITKANPANVEPVSSLETAPIVDKL